MLVQLDQWIPDADDITPGVIIDLDGMISTIKGYKGNPSPVSPGIEALSAECKGIQLLQILNGSNVLFAGTKTKLYMSGALTWTEVTRVSGVYTGSDTYNWRFSEFGNVSFAVNRTDKCQKYNHATDSDFSDLTAMPICSVAEAVGQFVMIANYVNPSGSVDTPDGWACSAISDYTDWTPSVDTQCVYGRLFDTPGPITGLKRLADYAIYYKRRSMYLARYVGSGNIWEFSLVSDTVGAVSNESISKVDAKHYFLGEDDFYSYDGATLQSIGGQIREWFNEQVNYKSRTLAKAMHDRVNGIVYWFYPTSYSATLNAFVAYNYRVGKWGKGMMDVEFASEYVTGSKKYSEIQTLYPNYNNFDGLVYYDLGTPEEVPKAAIVDTTHKLKTLSGVPGNSFIVPNIFGSEEQKTLISRVRNRYIDSPDTAFMTNYYSDQSGSDFTQDITTTEEDGKFDVLRSARWHRGKFEFTGQVEISGIDIQAKNAGKE